MIQDTQKILVLDDESFLRDLHAQLLEIWGYQTVTAEDGLAGRTAYGQAIQEQNPFDLIVSDIRMPKMTGPEFYRAISSEPTSPSPVPPIIYVSADRDTFQEQLIMDFPPVDLLRKPVNAFDLQRAITEALRKDQPPVDLRLKALDLIMNYHR